MLSLKTTMRNQIIILFLVIVAAAVFGTNEGFQKLNLAQIILGNPPVEVFAWWADGYFGDTDVFEDTAVQFRQPANGSLTSLTITRVHSYLDNEFLNPSLYEPRVIDGRNGYLSLGNNFINTAPYGRHTIKSIFNTVEAGEIFLEKSFTRVGPPNVSNLSHPGWFSVSVDPNLSGENIIVSVFEVRENLEEPVNVSFLLEEAGDFGATKVYEFNGSTDNKFVSIIDAGGNAINASLDSRKNLDELFFAYAETNQNSESSVTEGNPGSGSGPAADLCVNAIKLVVPGDLRESPERREARANAAYENLKAGLLKTKASFNQNYRDALANALIAEEPVVYDTRLPGSFFSLNYYNNLCYTAFNVNDPSSLLSMSREIVSRFKTREQMVVVAFDLLGTTLGNSDYCGVAFASRGTALVNSGLLPEYLFGNLINDCNLRAPLPFLSSALERTNSHELGHLLGLDHSSSPNNLMNITETGLYYYIDTNVTQQRHYMAGIYECSLDPGVKPAEAGIQLPPKSGTDMKTGNNKHGSVEDCDRLEVERGLCLSRDLARPIFGEGPGIPPYICKHTLTDPQVNEPGKAKCERAVGGAVNIDKPEPPRIMVPVRVTMTIDTELPPAPFCGNGIVEQGEACDDGNDDSTDGCINCRRAYCGDTFVRRGIESCDPPLSWCDYYTGEPGRCGQNCQCYRFEDPGRPEEKAEPL